MISIRYLIALLVAAASVPPVEAQGMYPGPNQINVHLINVYDVTLATMGLAGVHRVGVDSASGILTRNGDVYHGVLSARAKGTMEARSLIGNCSDASDGTQQIYAVAYIEQSPGILPTDSIGPGHRVGEIDLTFFFFPETDPDMVLRGNCQGTVGFDGYGVGVDENEAPYDWLPQFRPRGEFIPFNDSRWTSQNGLRVHAPLAGASLVYMDRSDVRPDQQINSYWIVSMYRGDN